MAVFEISINGDRRFVGDDVSSVTLSVDRSARSNGERVSVHVGVGESSQQVQHLGADLHPGDEIVIRVLSDSEFEASEDGGPRSCSFCGTSIFDIGSLVAGPQIGICNNCVVALYAVVMEGAALPLGASIRESGEVSCGFCRRAPPEVPGLFVRNAAAICPQCLRACMDMMSGSRDA